MNLMNIDKRFDTIRAPSEVHPRTDHFKCGPDVRNCTIHDDVVRKPQARCGGSRRTEGKAAGKLLEVRAPKLKRMFTSLASRRFCDVEDGSVGETSGNTFIINRMYRNEPARARHLAKIFPIVY